MLAGIEIARSLTLDVTALGVSQQQLGTQIEDDFAAVQGILNTLQGQIDSLVAVVLQNHSAGDLLTAQERGTCPFLEKKCCYCINKSGVVRDADHQLQEQINQ